MTKIKPRGFAAKRPARPLAQLIHDHPAIFTIMLIAAIGIAPALVEWIVG